MASNLIWGQFGDVVFEFMHSPVYGSYADEQSARYTEHNRIITRDDSGLLFGQKPIRQIAGLDLKRVTFSCKISQILLKFLEVGVGGRLAGAAGLGGSIAGSALGNEKDFTSFNQDLTRFENDIALYFEDQEPQEFIVGEIPQGLFTLDRIAKRIKHYQNGTIKFVEYDFELVEWIEEEI